MSRRYDDAEAEPLLNYIRRAAGRPPRDTDELQAAGCSGHGTGPEWEERSAFEGADPEDEYPD